MSDSNRCAWCRSWCGAKFFCSIDCADKWEAWDEAQCSPCETDEDDL